MSSGILDYPSCENLNSRIDGIHITDSSPFGYTNSSVLILAAYEGMEIAVYDSNTNRVISRIHHPLPISEILIHSDDVFAVLDVQYFITQYSISNPSTPLQKNQIPLKANNEKVVKVVSLTFTETTSTFQPKRLIDSVGVMLCYSSFPSVKILRTVTFSEGKLGSETVEEVSQYHSEASSIDLIPLTFPPLASFLYISNPDMRNNPFSEIFRVRGGKKVFKVATFKKIYDRIIKSPLLGSGSYESRGGEVILCLKNQDIGFHCMAEQFRVVCMTEVPDHPKVQLNKLSASLNTNSNEEEEEERKKKRKEVDELLVPYLRLQLLHRIKIDYSIESERLNFSTLMRRYLVLPRGSGMLGLIDLSKGETVFFWNTSGAEYNNNNNNNSMGGGIFGGGISMSTGSGGVSSCYLLPNGKILVFEKKESSMVSFDDFDPERFRKKAFDDAVAASGGGNQNNDDNSSSSQMMISKRVELNPVDLKIFDIYGMFNTKMMTERQILSNRDRLLLLLNQVDHTIKIPRRPMTTHPKFDLLKVIFENDKGERKEIMTYKSLFDLYYNFEVIQTLRGDVVKNVITKNRIKRPNLPPDHSCNELKLRIPKLRIMYLNPITTSVFNRILLGCDYVFIPSQYYLSFFYLFSHLTLHTNRLYRQQQQQQQKQQQKQQQQQRQQQQRKGVIKNGFFLLLEVICKRVSEIENRQNILTLFTRSCKLFELISSKQQQQRKKSSFGGVGMNMQVKFRSLFSRYCFARLYKLSMASPEGERDLERVIQELFGKDRLLPEITSFEQSVDLSDSISLSYETNFNRAMLRIKPIIHDVFDDHDDEMKKKKDIVEEEEEEEEEQQQQQSKQKRYYSDQRMVTLKLSFVGEEEENVSVEVIPEILIRTSNYFYHLFTSPNSKQIIKEQQQQQQQNSNNNNEVFVISNHHEEESRQKLTLEEQKTRHYVRMNIDLFLNIVKYFYNPSRFCDDEKNFKRLIELLIFSEVYDEFGLKCDVCSLIQKHSTLLIVTQTERTERLSSSSSSKQNKKKDMKDEDEEEEEEDKFEDLTFENMLRDVSYLLAQSLSIKRFLIDFWARVSNYSTEEVTKMVEDFSKLSPGSIRVDYGELNGLKWGAVGRGSLQKIGASVSKGEQQKQKEKKKKGKEMKDEDEEEEETGEEMEEEEGEGETEYEEGEEEEEEGELGDEGVESEDLKSQGDDDEMSGEDIRPQQQQEEEQPQQPQQPQQQQQHGGERMIDEEGETVEQQRQQQLGFQSEIQPQQQQLLEQLPSPQQPQQTEEEEEEDGFGFKKKKKDPFDFSFDDFKLDDDDPNNNNNNNNNNNSNFNQPQQSDVFTFVPLVEKKKKKKDADDQEDEEQKKKGDEWWDFDKKLNLPSKDWKFE